MSNEFKYIQSYDFIIEGVALYIDQDSWGIKIQTLKECFSTPIQYKNQFGDLISISLCFDNQGVKKAESHQFIDSISGKVSISFPTHIGENYDRRKMDTYFKCLIYLLFFIFNVSCPGCFEIGRAKYTLFNISILKDTGKEYIINGDTTYNGNFDFYSNEDFYQIAQQDIISFNEIPLVKVVQRTQKLNIWFNQLSSEGKRLESAIYGFYHIFLKEGFTDHSLEKVLYATLTLEALYNIPKESIGSILISRIKFLMQNTILNQNKFKKIFSKFYDLRSKIIHGSYQIHNPIIFDNFCDDPEGMGKIWDDTSEIIIIYAIIIGSFQQIIVKGLINIEFIETLNGS